MPISKKEVEHIARLARIELSDAELEKFKHQLSSILDYVSKLKKVDVDKKATIISGATNVFRKDNVRRSDRQKKLLEQTPNKKDNYFKVKAVLK